MSKNYIVSAIVAVVVSLAVVLSVGHSSQPAPIVGGLENNSRQNFPVGLTASAMGGTSETIASGSVTFTARQICSDNMVVQSGILNTGVASAQTNTLPTAASLIANCLPSRGDQRTVRFENNALQGSGRFVYTFQLGAGIDVFVASTSESPIVTSKNRAIRPEEALIVRFTNVNGSSVSADFTKMVNGD